MGGRSFITHSASPQAIRLDAGLGAIVNAAKFEIGVLQRKSGVGNSVWIGFVEGEAVVVWDEGGVVWNWSIVSKSRGRITTCIPMSALQY